MQHFYIANGENVCDFPFQSSFSLNAYLNISCLVIRWHFWCCSTGRGQRLVPGNAEEAGGIEIDEEQDPEEEPPNLLNGTVPSALSGVTADTSFLLWPTFSLQPHCLHLFTCATENFLFSLVRNKWCSVSLSTIGVTFIQPHTICYVSLWAYRTLDWLTSYVCHMWDRLGLWNIWVNAPFLSSIHYTLLRTSEPYRRELSSQNL